MNDETMMNADEAPEFSRLFKVEQIANGSAFSSGEANGDERAALAERFDLHVLDTLRFEAEVSQWRGGARVRGRVIASGAQVCVVTLDPAPMTIDEPFDRGFLPENVLTFEGGKPGQELEIAFDKDTDDSPETLGEAIDLGEIAAEAFGLALDPYPRAPGAEIAMATATPKGAEPIRDEDVKPFAALAKLKGAQSTDEET